MCGTKRREEVCAAEHALVIRKLRVAPVACDLPPLPRAHICGLWAPPSQAFSKTQNVRYRGSNPAAQNFLEDNISRYNSMSQSMAPPFGAPGESVRRAGDEIVVCGQLFHTGTRYVPRLEDISPI
eukprot:9171344-Pyramimonas_sp.AAC.1